MRKYFYIDKAIREIKRGIKLYKDYPQILEAYTGSLKKAEKISVSNSHRENFDRFYSNEKELVDLQKGVERYNFDEEYGY